MWCRLEAQRQSAIVEIGQGMEPAETGTSTPAPLKIKGCGTPPYFCASISSKEKPLAMVSSPPAGSRIDCMDVAQLREKNLLDLFPGHYTRSGSEQA